MKYRKGIILSGIFTALNKKRHCKRNAVNGCREISDSSLNLVRTEASGTGVHMARSTVHNSLDPLYVGLPSSVGTSVRVGNLNAEGNTLATIITLSHSLHLQSEIKNSKLRPHRRLAMIADISKKSKCFFGIFLFFENNVDIRRLSRYNGFNIQKGVAECLMFIVFI